jgi:PAS domain S-box-containing protein
VFDVALSGGASPGSFASLGMSVSSRPPRAVTEADQLRRRLEGLIAITRILSGGATFEDVLPAILAAVRTTLDADVCELWRPDRDTSEQLVLSATDHAASDTARRFAQQSRDVRFESAQGLPGRVWRSGRPEWIENLGGDERFVWRREAESAELRSAMAFPLQAGGEIFGVVAVYLRAPLHVDDVLSSILTTLGSQIGEHVWRQQVQQELRSSQGELRDFVENATIGLHWVGPDGTILWANQSELQMMGYARDEYIGRHIADFYVDRTVIQDILERLGRNESLYDYEARLRRKDGTIIDVAISSNVLWHDGEFRHTRCFTRNITKAKHSEETRRAAQRQFTSFMEHLPGAAWMKDTDGRYVYANQYALRIFATPREKLYGFTDWDVFPPATAQQFRDNDLRVIEEAQGIQTFEQLRHDDGIVHESIVSKFPIFDNDGRIQFVGGVAIDVTRQRTMEKELRDSEQRNRATFNTAAVGIVEYGLEGAILRVNEQFCRMTGYASQELLRLSLPEIMHRDDAQRGAQHFQRLQTSGPDKYGLEVRFVHKRGQVVWVMLMGSLVHDEQGSPVYGIGVATDITQQKRVHEEKRQLAAIVESSHDAIVAETLDGTILSWNNAAERLYGYSAEEMIGGSVSLILPDDRQDEVQDIAARLRSGERIQHFETLRRDRQGRLIDVSLSISPIFDDERQLTAFSVVSHDITSTKQTQDALRRSEATLRSFCDNSPMLMGIVELVDQDILHVYDNPATEAFFGAPAGGTTGRLASQLGAPPEAVAHWRAQYLASQRSGAPVRFEYQHHGTESGGWLSATVSFIDYSPSGTARFCYVAEDITPRKIAEQRIRSEMELRQAIENAVPDGIAACDTEGRQVYVNAALCRMLGWSEDELTGRLPPYPYWPPEEMENITSAFQQTLRGESPPDGFQLRFMRKSGERFDVLVRVGGVASPAAIRGWLASVTDITQRTRAESALRESEERLRFTLQAAGVGSWDWNVQSDEVKWSDNLEAVHGRPPGTFGGSMEDVLNEVYADDRAQVRSAIEQALAGGAVFEVEYRFRRQDGSIGWLHGQGKAMFDAGGRPIRMAGICMDVTQRRRADQAARLLAELGVILATSLDSESTLPDVAHLLVPTLGDWCIIDLLNDNKELLTPIIVHADPRKAEVAKSLRKRYPPRLDAPYGLGAVLSSGRPELHAEITDEMLRRAAIDGEYYEAVRKLGVKSSLIVPLVARGRTLGAMTLVSAESDRTYGRHDLGLVQELATRCALAIDNTRLYREAQREIEERKEAEKMLRAAREAAESANRAKSEFLANISHEIRTPMAAVLGYAELLGRHLHDPEQLQSVEIIRRNGRFLLEILNDVLDLSRIEAGRMEVERQRFRPHDLFFEVRRLMEVPAREKNLPLYLEFEGDIPETIEGDPTRLRQIVVNLVGNALKFTERGDVRIKVRLLEEEEKLCFDVRDTGIGLSDDQLERLFQPFTQADSSVTRRFGGSGVGLVISKRLAELLGGQITVASQVGQGSTFSVRVATGSLQGVPRIRPEEAPQTPDPEGDFAGWLNNRRILIVDDRREVRDLVQRCIEDAGGQVQTASHGREALEQIKELESQSPLDAVLMDMQMPIMDGYQAVRRLRSDGFSRPIIALTAHAMQGDREKCLAAGCDDYISKPIDRRELVERVRRAILTPVADRERARRAAFGDGASPRNALVSSADLPAEQETAEQTLRILLVDDSHQMCKILSLLLSTRGYDVRSAHSGRTGLQLAQQFRPDVVLLDLTLPDMSGYEVVAQLRDNAALSETVLIALSGHSGPEVMTRSYQAGFHHHLVKPADLEQLEAVFPRRKTSR